MKSAHINLYHGKYYVEAYSQTRVGLWIATEHIFVIEEGDERGLARS